MAGAACPVLARTDGHPPPRSDESVFHVAVSHPATMFSRQAEQHHQDNKAPSTKGPMFKQASEEVEAIFGLIAPLLEAAASSARAPEGGEEARATAAALQGVIERADALRDKVLKMRAKALETDPDLQSYGPAMKEKVLKLCGRFEELEDTLGRLQEEHQSTFQVAEQAKKEEAERLEREAKERVQAEARLEAEEYERDKAAKERERKEREEARRAAAIEEEKKRQHAQQKMREAEQREREAAGRPAKPDPEQRFVECPLGEGGEELTIEVAMQLQERSDACMAAFQQACRQVLMGNDKEAVLEAGKTIRAYLLSILDQPQSREFRTIPTENKVFKEKIDALNGGRDAMLALGFEQETEPDGPNGERGRSILVMNQISVDNVRACLAFLDSAVR